MKKFLAAMAVLTVVATPDSPKSARRGAQPSNSARSRRCRIWAERRHQLAQIQSRRLRGVPWLTPASRNRRPERRQRVSACSGGGNDRNPSHSPVGILGLSGSLRRLPIARRY